MKAMDAAVWWVPGGACGVLPEAAFERADLDLPSGFRWMPAAAAFDTAWLVERTPATARLSLFTLFNTMTVRDRVDPQVAHRALLAIDEYRTSLAPDVEGAA